MNKKITRRLEWLDRETKALFEELSAYPEEVLNQRPGPEGWSINMILHHVRLAEKLSLDYVKKKLSFQPELKNAGPLTWSRDTLLRFFFLLPVKIKAPKYIGDDVLPKESRPADIKEKWLEQRRELADYLKDLPPHLFEKAIYKHPIGGRLTLGGMLTTFQNHFKRHRKQIRTILEKVEHNKTISQRASSR